MKKNTFEQLEKTRNFIKKTHDMLIETRVELSNQKYKWLEPSLMEEFNSVIEKLEKAHANLCKPCLKIAFIGTTSSGKSTLLNGLSGHRIAPMDDGEMSAGVVRIRNAAELSLDVQETAGMTWPAGSYKVHNDEDIYNILRPKDTGIMSLYRQASKEDANIAAPLINITAQLAPKYGGILNFRMPEEIGLEFYDLPGLKAVTDSRNLEVIQRHLTGSFLLIVLNYSDTNSERRNALLSEVRKIIEQVCRNKDAVIFVLNRIDERNTDNDPLEVRVRLLQEDIKEQLKLSEVPLIIPMSALPLYLIQAAWGAEEVPIYKQGLAQKSRDMLEKFFDDCPRVIHALRSSPEKKKWFKANDMDNIEDWAVEGIPMLREWIYEYSGAFEFWNALQKKLDENIGAVLINPALVGTPALLDDFTVKLDNVVHILGMSTIEEIDAEKSKIENLSKDIKKNLNSFKSEFTENFKQSIQACKSGETDAMTKMKYTQMLEIRNILTEIDDDIHENIMIPIRNALVDGDLDKLNDLEFELSKVVPPQLASNIKRSANQLLIKGYLDYAIFGNKFECRENEKDRHTEKIKKLEIIEKCRMILADCVDKAMLARSQLLMQQKIHLFTEMAQNIIAQEMNKLDNVLNTSLAEYNVKGISLPVNVKEATIDLPNDVFSKITISEATKVMKKTIKEYY